MSAWQRRRSVGVVSASWRRGYPSDRQMGVHRRREAGKNILSGRHSMCQVQKKETAGNSMQFGAQCEAWVREDHSGSHPAPGFILLTLTCCILQTQLLTVLLSVASLSSLGPDIFLSGSSPSLPGSPPSNPTAKGLPVDFKRFPFSLKDNKGLSLNIKYFECFHHKQIINV